MGGATQEYVAEHGDYEKLGIARLPRKGSGNHEENILVLYENFALSVFAVCICIDFYYCFYENLTDFVYVLHQQFKPHFELDLFQRTFEMLYSW